MPRPASPTDFIVPVEGVGDFVFGRRKMADHLKIEVEYARITEGVLPTPWLDKLATWLATLRVLAVRVPEGFNIDELDPLEEETYAKLMKVHIALREKEGSFRRRPAPASEGSGQAEGGQPRVLVPE